MEEKDIRTRVATNGGDHLTRFGDLWKSQVEKIKQKFSAEVEEVRMPVEYPTDHPIIYVKKDFILEVLRFLKEEQGFEYQFLSDLTCTDEMPNEYRFEVVYNLFSQTRFSRIRVKTRVKEGEKVQSAIGLWKGADWAEREVYDMFGVEFENHPDLRRILMDIRWQGHPLRKDYPLRGYQIYPTPEPIDPELLK